MSIMKTLYASMSESITYDEPKESNNMADILTRRCILRPLRTCTGRTIPSTMSINNITPIWAYEILIWISSPRQVPPLNGLITFSQKKLTGLHVKMTNRNVTTDITVVQKIATYNVYIWIRSMTIRKSVKAKEILMNAVPRRKASSLTKRS